MTAPRQVLEGTTYVVTRRASERRFLLRPSKKTTAIIGYLLAGISERYGILFACSPITAGFEEPSELTADLLSRLRQAEDHAAAELASSGRSFIGVARVLAQKPDARPAPGEPRRGLSPRVACRNKWKRIEALLRLAEFRTAYREALAAWRAGARDVTFPPGTWLMRVQHRVCCPAPA